MGNEAAIKPGAQLVITGGHKPLETLRLSQLEFLPFGHPCVVYKTCELLAFSEHRMFKVKHLTWNDSFSLHSCPGNDGLLVTLSCMEKIGAQKG